jgi:glycosyltransferase involved in cell wall biosynthesis
LIFPGEDDFGIVPVEAMSEGTPVIALRKGGAKETVVPGVTGDFFDHPVAPLIAEAVVRFVENEKKYDHAAISRHAEKFSRERFEAEIRDYVEKIVSETKI